MEWMPALRLEWLGGWLLLLLVAAVEGLYFLLIPRKVLSRLFDRKHWSRKQRAFTRLGKVFSLVCLILIILAPLKTGSAVFALGLLIYVVGLVGLVVAMLNFKDTPLDQPVTTGIYRISRHPQIVSVSVAILGICVAVGSWPALIALLISRSLQHFGILAEEDACIKLYGEDYRAYMERVPRYFLFF